MQHRIAPSILCADRARFTAEAARVAAAGADAIHFDVMAPEEITRLTLGHGEAMELQGHLKRPGGGTVPLDVHFAVQPHEALVECFVEAGADTVSFHPSTTPNVAQALHFIRGTGCKAGLAFDPAEPMDVLEWVIEEVDLVLVMSVRPGYGGQAFLESSMRRIERARRLIEAERARSGREVSLAVEGGIKASNIRRIADAGADTFIVGSAVFGQKDYAAAMASLRAELDGTSAFRALAA